MSDQITVSADSMVEIYSLRLAESTRREVVLEAALREARAENQKLREEIDAQAARIQESSGQVPEEG